MAEKEGEAMCYPVIKCPKVNVRRVRVALVKEVINPFYLTGNDYMLTVRK